MSANPLKKLVVQLPDRLAHPPSILRTMELYPSRKGISAPRARLVLGRNTGPDQDGPANQAACRYLLQKVLSSVSPNEGLDWTLHYSNSGAPCVSGQVRQSPLHVSMAHSENWLAAGVAIGARIGVDVECLKPRKNMTAMAEFLGWNTQVQDTREFYGKWTLWEASAKCVEGNVFMQSNVGFDHLCPVDTQGRVGGAERWAGLNGCLDNALSFAVVLKCQAEVEMCLCELELGNTEPW